MDKCLFFQQFDYPVLFWDLFFVAFDTIFGIPPAAEDLFLIWRYIIAIFLFALLFIAILFIFFFAFTSTNNLYSSNFVALQWTSLPEKHQLSFILLFSGFQDFHSIKDHMLDMLAFYIFWQDFMLFFDNNYPDFFLQSIHNTYSLSLILVYISIFIKSVYHILMPIAFLLYFSFPSLSLSTCLFLLKLFYLPFENNLIISVFHLSSWNS